MVVGARVQATNAETSASVSSFSNESGGFTIPFTPIGRYKVSAQAPGFKTYGASNIDLRAGEKVNLDIHLQLGGTTDTMEVTSEPPPVNSVNAEQDVNLDSNRVHELPLLNRDIAKIVDLGTGS